MSSNGLLPPPGYAQPSLCGAGATSHVYRALETRSGQWVALKRLHRQLVRDEVALGRLRRELEALTALRHPGIVQVRGVISWQGAPTIVMDYLDGVDLKERIQCDGRLDFAEAERVARAMLDALASTHAAGIVHRDLKPQNVRLTSDGRVLLLDFGSARLGAASQLTSTGTTVGTPEYMAPELFSGSAYDPRVDLYGVGATLYEALTGAPPLPADTLAELAYRRATEDAPSVESARPGCPESLYRLVDRCLARLPEDRFPSAARALWALDHPEEERARARLRSSHPPCLHCHAPTPPTAPFCGSCGSDHPFAYSPGTSEVRLISAADPERLVLHVAEQFPERAHPKHLAAVAQVAALLPSGERPLLRGVAAREAKSIRAELEALGVRARITEPISNKKLTALAVPFAALALLGFGSLVAGGVAFVAFLGLGRLLTLTGPPTLLGPSGRSALGTRGFQVGMAIAFAAPLLLGAVKRLAEVATHGSVDPATPAHLLLTIYGPMLAVAAVYVLGRWLLRTDSSALPRRLCPEPSLLGRLKAAILGGERGTIAPSAGDRALAGAMFAVGVALLIPGELFLLQEISARAALQSAPPVVSAPVAPASPSRPGAQGVQPVAPQRPQPARYSGYEIRHATWFVSQWLRANPRAVLIATPGLGLLLLLPLVVRRRRVRAEARRILEAADAGRLASAARRTAPMSRRPSHGLAPGGDGFIASVARHALEVEAALNREEAARMWSSIREVAEVLERGARREASLDARCILETDGEQRLRFELLRMAGELETKAALAWARDQEQQGTERDPG